MAALRYISYISETHIFTMRLVLYQNPGLDTLFLRLSVVLADIYRF